MTRNDREISFDRNFLRLENIQELDIKTEMKKNRRAIMNQMKG